VAQAAAGSWRGEQEKDRHGWRQEGKDLLRAVAGGAIVGMPLLYTMEMWWHGMTLSPRHLLILLVAILAVNFLFNLLSGFRRGHSVPEAVMEAVTAVGIGIVFSALVLWLIGELKPGVAPAEAVGKILLEAAVVSIGVSFANSQVLGKSRTGEEENGDSGGEGEGTEESQDSKEDPNRLQLHADLKDVGATLAGATVFALNVAPTEEIIMIASRLSPWQQLILLGAILVVCYVILFASGFAKHEVHVETPFQHPVTETVMVCALSLGVAYGLLLLIGQRDMMTHAATAIAATVTLGLPAAVGGAAGRLIV
jgi:putative integral membrane protein (TIGR02587 family)